MQLTALGAGPSIVNALCRPPPSTVARRFEGLPAVTYRLIRRRDDRGAALEDLCQHVLGLRGASEDLHRGS
jgi:hypothetical protein